MKILEILCLHSIYLHNTILSKIKQTNIAYILTIKQSVWTFIVLCKTAFTKGSPWSAVFDHNHYDKGK